MHESIESLRCCCRFENGALVSDVSDRMLSTAWRRFPHARLPVRGASVAAARAPSVTLPFAPTLAPVDAASVLTDAHVEAFARDGAIVVRGVFGPDWVEALRAAAEDNMASPGPLCDEHAAAAGTKGRFHDDQFLWKRHKAFEQYVTESGAASIAARALGSKSAHIYYDQLLVKEPGTSSPTPWHNDTSYWPLSGSQICSIWVALDTVPKDSGVAYVKGSHKWAIRHRVTNFSGDAHSAKNTYDGVTDMAFDPLPDVDGQVAKGQFELLKWDVSAPPKMAAHLPGPRVLTSRAWLVQRRAAHSCRRPVSRPPSRRWSRATSSSSTRPHCTARPACRQTRPAGAAATPRAGAATTCATTRGRARWIRAGARPATTAASSMATPWPATCTRTLPAECARGMSLRHSSALDAS